MKNHRAGGVYTNSHTTLTELGVEVADFLEERVEKITIGVVKNNGGKGSAFSVKIITESACTLVRITQNSSVQELRFYTRNPQKVRLELARFVRGNGWQLKFGKTI